MSAHVWVTALLRNLLLQALLSLQLSLAAVRTTLTVQHEQVPLTAFEATHLFLLTHIPNLNSDAIIDTYNHFSSHFYAINDEVKSSHIRWFLANLPRGNLVSAIERIADRG